MRFQINYGPVEFARLARAANCLAKSHPHAIGSLVRLPIKS
jgi:hypothetical protein